MELIKRIEDKFLSIFPGYRDLKEEWEITNRDLSTEIAKKNKYKDNLETTEQQRDELIRRCYDAIDMVEATRLKDETKDKIIAKLRGISL